MVFHGGLPCVLLREPGGLDRPWRDSGPEQRAVGEARLLLHVGARLCLQGRHLLFLLPFRAEGGTGLRRGRGHQPESRGAVHAHGQAYSGSQRHRPLRFAGQRRQGLHLLGRRRPAHGQAERQPGGAGFRAASGGRLAGGFQGRTLRFRAPGEILPHFPLGARQDRDPGLRHERPSHGSLHVQGRNHGAVAHGLLDQSPLYRGIQRPVVLVLSP